MKKQLSLFVIFLPFIFALTSCGCHFKVNKRTNYIEAGYYEGNAADDETAKGKLTITAIDKDEYEASNGVDTIKDLAKEGYYKLEFYISYNNQEFEHFTFNNLKDKYDGAKYRPISYIDDFGNIFTPMPFSRPRHCSVLTPDEFGGHVNIEMRLIEENKNV